jgi:hypothetical protein
MLSDLLLTRDAFFVFNFICLLCIHNFENYINFVGCLSSNMFILCFNLLIKSDYFVIICYRSSRYLFGSIYYVSGFKFIFLFFFSCLNISSVYLFLKKINIKKYTSYNYLTVQPKSCFRSTNG